MAHNIGGHHNNAFTRIIELRPSMEKINTVFIILEKGKPDKVPDHAATPICYALVADQTASVNLQLWYASQLGHAFIQP
eukprot:7484567-Pyramimonas_sp.AAC.1